MTGQTRVEAYPGLNEKGREYDPEEEEAQWDVQRVWRYMGKKVWTRTVDTGGANLAV